MGCASSGIEAELKNYHKDINKFVSLSPIYLQSLIDFLVAVSIREL